MTPSVSSGPTFSAKSPQCAIPEPPDGLHFLLVRPGAFREKMCGMTPMRRAAAAPRAVKLETRLNRVGPHRDYFEEALGARVKRSTSDARMKAGRCQGQPVLRIPSPPAGLRR